MGQGRCTRAQGQNTRAQGLNMKGQGQEHCMREQGQNTRAPVQGLGNCMRRNRRKVLLQQQRRRGTLSCHQRGFSSPESSKSLEGCQISFRLKFPIQSHQVCHSDIYPRGAPLQWRQERQVKGEGAEPYLAPARISLVSRIALNSRWPSHI